MIKTNRGRLHTESWSASQGPHNLAPIVLLHDSLGSVQQWRDFPRRLAGATGHPVIAYDRLGFGQSDPHPGRLGLDFIPEEAHGSFASLIEQLSLERFFVIGHSVGGGMALAIAAAYPERCCGVVTESAQAFVEAQTLEAIRAAKEQFAATRQLDRLRKYHGDKAGWVLQAWTDTWLDPAFASWSLDAELPLLRSPALVIHGTRDEYGTLRHPQRIRSLVTAPVTFACLNGCGHVPHREQALAVLDAIRTFIQK